MLAAGNRKPPFRPVELGSAPASVKALPVERDFPLAKVCHCV